MAPSTISISTGSFFFLLLAFEEAFEIVILKGLLWVLAFTEPKL